MYYSFTLRFKKLFILFTRKYFYTVISFIRSSIWLVYSCLWFISWSWMFISLINVYSFIDISTPVFLIAIFYSRQSSFSKTVSAKHIQKWSRSTLARTTEIHMMTASAIQIQKYWRTFTQYSRFKIMQYKIQEFKMTVDSAVLIQKNWRCLIQYSHNMKLYSMQFKKSSWKEIVKLQSNRIGVVV